MDNNYYILLTCVGQYYHSEYVIDDRVQFKNQKPYSLFNFINQLKWHMLY